MSDGLDGQRGRFSRRRTGKTWTFALTFALMFGTGISPAQAADLPVVSDAVVTPGSVSASGVAATAEVTANDADTTVSVECSTDPSFVTDVVPGVMTTPNPVTGTDPTEVAGTCSGLQPVTDYYVRFGAINAESSPDTVHGGADSFTTWGPPFVGAASVDAGSVDQDSASASASVDAHGAETTVSMQCAKNDQFTDGVVTGSVTSTPNPIPGTDGVAVEGTCEGLEEGIQYFVRFGAISEVSDPDVIYGDADWFTTWGPPFVGAASVDAGSVDQDSASASASVDAHGAETTVSMQCAKNDQFTDGVVTGNVTSTPNPIPGTDGVAVEGTCEGLEEGIQYFVRFGAISSLSDPDVIYGDADWFTTWGPPFVGAAVVDAGSIGATSVEASASVDAHGADATVSMQCATNDQFTTGLVDGSVTSAPNPVPGPDTASVTGKCEGLEMDTQYFVRFGAISSLSDPDVIYGDADWFTTLGDDRPTVSAAVVTTVAATSVSAAAAVDGKGTSTQVSIQCARDAAFTAGLTTGVMSTENPVTSPSPVAVVGTCSNLVPDTDYHVRFVATYSLDPSSTAYGLSAVARTQAVTPTPTPTPTPSVQAQQPEGNCVVQGGRNSIPRRGNRTLVKPHCETNAGQVVGVRVAAKTGFGDVVNFQLYCKRAHHPKTKTVAAGYGKGMRYCPRGALKIRTFGKRLQLRVEWHAPAVPGYRAFTSIRTYRT